ncbi:hypothetical protein [Amycolatopsis dendrobii]|uniref:Uncharacterized protein n=1 Tax=Amycolatopsis dendrobii TaxID=2760662 RepID=A0A7W3VW27_9PSEU|nr:hypothetical protein [Amycolatopsis dendrobii]MBB1154266.1 hypothetical protein [Amycolatopsis dendrobii]
MPTQAEVRVRLLGHFTETLRALPSGSALVLRHPDLPKAVFHNGVALSDDYGRDETRRFFDIAYWVLGAAAETSEEYLDLTMRSWRDRGWATEFEADPSLSAGYARTADGYGFAIRRSLNGYLSMAGTTPVFPADSPEGDPLPGRIDWPAVGSA